MNHFSQEILERRRIGKMIFTAVDGMQDMTYLGPNNDVTDGTWWIIERDEHDDDDKYEYGRIFVPFYDGYSLSDILRGKPITKPAKVLRRTVYDAAYEEHRHFLDQNEFRMAVLMSKLNRSSGQPHQTIQFRKYNLARQKSVTKIASQLI